MAFGREKNQKLLFKVDSKLKFPRFLLRLTYSSMNVNRANFVFVPNQDFNRSYSDEDLYKKYNLTEDEVAYIERLIRPME